MYTEINTEFTPPEQDAEWLENRRKSIGASEVGAILGVSKYKSAWHVYQDKKGLTPAFDGNELTHFAHLHEDTIMQEVSRRTGYVCKRHQETLYHPIYDFMTCTPDALIYVVEEGAAMGQNVPLEIKTASAYLQAQWEEDGIPLDYQAQVNYQMAIYGSDIAYLAVLFGGNHLKIYRIERDSDLTEMVIEKVKSFWEDNVLTDTAPEVSDLDTDAINDLYDQTTDDEVEIDDKLVKELAEAEREAEKWQDVIDTRKNALKQQLKEAETGRGSKYIVSWKATSPRTTIDTKALRTELPQVFSKYARVGKASRRFTYCEVKS